MANYLNKALNTLKKLVTECSCKISETLAAIHVIMKIKQNKNICQKVIIFRNYNITDNLSNTIKLKIKIKVIE